MGRSHNRRNPVGNRQSSSDQLVVCATRLHSYLLNNSTVPTHLNSIVLQSLDQLIHNPNQTIQLQLQLIQHIPSLLIHATDPTFRLRLAHFINNLSQLLSDPNSALPILSNLCTSSSRSTHPRDTAALSVIFRAITTVANEGHSPKASRDAIEHAVPVLTRPLAAAIVQSRPAALDTHADSSATDDVLGSLSAPRAHVRIAPIRPDALAALTALASKSPRAFIPFWSLFLPDLPAVAQNPSYESQNLATLILYDEWDDIRSAAVTAAYTLIVGTRSFIRNIRPSAASSHRASSIAFTSSSTRVLHTCSSMYIIVATALGREKSGVVVAKLARLATELLTSLPLPIVQSERLVILFQSLRKRASDIDESDLTARAAVLRSLATAVAKSGPNIDVCELDQFVSEMVANINAEVYMRLEAEALGLLTRVIEVRSKYFDFIYSQLVEMIDNAIIHQKPDYQLHAVRLLEAYIASIVCVFQNSDSGEEKAVDTKLDLKKVVLTCLRLYDLYIQITVHSPDQAIQLSSMSAISSLLKVIGFGSLQDHSLSHDQLQRPVVDIISKCQQLQQSESRPIVQQAAVKALSFLPIRVITQTEEVEVVQFLTDLAKREELHSGVREKALFSLSAILDKSREIPDCEHDYFQQVYKVAVDIFNDTFPKTEHLSCEQPKIKKKYSETFRVASINLARSCICSSFSPNVHLEMNENNRTSYLIECLGRVLHEKNEALFLRCSCCHALESVFKCITNVHPSHMTINVEYAISAMEDILSVANAVQLQISACRGLEVLLVSDEYGDRIVKVLREWVEGSKSYDECHTPDERRSMKQIHKKLEESLMNLESSRDGKNVINRSVT